MIVIQTKLKVLPKKCNKCKYSYLRYDDRFCAVSFIHGMNRSCPYEYNEAKRNWEYGKPDWCPLREIHIDKELNQSTSSEYKCLDRTRITPDVGYVSDWWDEYKQHLQQDNNKNIWSTNPWDNYDKQGVKENM